jgi:DNA-directed RNA polymerase specialized sigma24 family protein
MNDPRLAAELRSSSPDALPELLDVYGDRLFSFCWTLLRNRENAQIAVRDALIAATAHAGRLIRDEWLGSWLYCLARAECRLRAAVPGRDADEPAVRPGRDDADSRLMAWRAVTSLDVDELEALELDCRHQVDLGLILGLPPADVDVLLGQARGSLERALTAEIVVARSHGCPDRAVVLAGWTGVITPSIRDRVLEHAATCPVCGPHLPRRVSAARVFAQLPAPELSPLARLEILGFVSDPRMSAYQEFAASRAAEVTGSAFLTQPAAALGQDAAATGPLPVPGTPERSWRPAPMGATGPIPIPAQLGPAHACPMSATPEPASPEPARLEPVLASVRTGPQQRIAGPSARSRTDVAQGFIGSWQPSGSAPAATRARLAAIPAQAAASPAGPAGRPAGHAGRHSAPAGQPTAAARSADPAQRAPAAGPTVASSGLAAAAFAAADRPAAPAGLAAVSRTPTPLAAVPAAPAGPAAAPLAPAGPAGLVSAPARLVPDPAAPPAAAPGLTVAGQPAPAEAVAGQAQRHGGRRFRGPRRLGAAAAVAATLTAAIAFLGLHGTHTSQPGQPAAALATQSGSGTIQPGGGADVTAPVEVTGGGLARTRSPRSRDVTATRAESLAVTATQPDPAGPGSLGSRRSRPSAGAASAGHSGDSVQSGRSGQTTLSPTVSPSAASSQSGSPAAAGTLTMAPARLDLGSGTEGQITLTADGGPVSWSASTSSGWLTLSSSQGTLQAGQSVTLTVTVSRHGGRGGSAAVVVDWSPVTPAAAVPATAPTSSQAVQVSWSADPQASPSPSASGSAPSPPPSPAASSLMGQ